MKAPQLIACLGLALSVLLVAGESRASHVNPHNQSVQKDDPKGKYKYYAASSLSGIHILPNKASGTFLLTFDQHISEMGSLLIKDTSGKVIYTGLVNPGPGNTARTMDVGKLTPGLYTIEVKSADTTFWKKVRIRK
ncbi:T9SS type A sorting domain-containing protein [Adhaeribacter aquaticus]|uniref:T9SS type A sorting domain-containing protein n=1 Tax=Adhaeribacter aquaticus TaxID=299567 RepID=UPI00068645D2|nr:T9SS type A sorting domain-containing protein [Adhaeribacter aquaticus]